MRFENKPLLQDDPRFFQDITSTAVEVGLTLVPTGSLRSAQFAVFPGSLRVRLWQRRDPSKHADKPNRVSQSLGLIDRWPVWSGRVRICFGRSANTSDLRRD